MSRRRTGPALVALALMLFTYLTSEVFAAGAMVPIQRELGASAGAVGSLVTVYAVVAAVAIPVVSPLTRRVPARVLLAGAMGALAVSHIVVALAPSLTWMVVARGGAASFHGVVWAAAPVVAASMLPGRPGRATSYVFLGSSLGNVLGAPLVAALSEWTSWRLAAAALGAVSVVCAVALAVFVPAEPPGSSAGDESAPSAPECTEGPTRASAVRVARWSAVVVLLAAAHLASYTYIAELAVGAGLPGSRLFVLLLGMGVAGLAATALAGRLHDRRPTTSLPVALVVLAVGFALTTRAMPAFGLGAVLWAAAYSALTVALQAFVLRDAPTWGRQASAWYVLAFQVGIALGAGLGGLLVGRPGGVGLLGPLSLAATVAAGLVVVATQRVGASTPTARREV